MIQLKVNNGNDFIKMIINNTISTIINFITNCNCYQSNHYQYEYEEHVRDDNNSIGKLKYCKHYN